MIAALLLACGASDGPDGPSASGTPAPVDVAPGPDPVDPTDGADDDGFGAGCGAHNEQACFSWAQQVRHSPKDYTSMLGPSCERGFAVACATLGHWLERDKAAPPTQIAKIFRYGCTRGDGGACLGLSRYVEGEERDVTLERGCALGSYWACHHAGLPLPVEEE